MEHQQLTDWLTDWPASVHLWRRPGDYSAKHQVSLFARRRTLFTHEAALFSRFHASVRRPPSPGQATVLLH